MAKMRADRMTQMAAADDHPEDADGRRRHTAKTTDAKAAAMTKGCWTCSSSSGQ